MKKLLLILLCLPQFLFSQTSFLTDDYKLFDINSLSSFLKESKKKGYILERNKNNEMIIYLSPMDAVIHLNKNIQDNTIGFSTYNIGSVHKIVHLWDDDLSDVKIWKVETIISLLQYSNISSASISNRFDKIENFLNRSILKSKYKLIESNEIYDIQDPYKVNYEILEEKKYEKKSNADLKVTLRNGRTTTYREIKGERRAVEKMYFSTENLLWSEFMNIAVDVTSESANDNRTAFDKLKFRINNIDIREVNTFDLEAMIDIFLEDCKKNNIFISKKQKITAKFASLEGTILALSYGMGLDEEIIVVVDPRKWGNASIEKKWYVIYHELGHDVLNFEHGQGGKMMFTFADREYTWDEFFDDKNYMFNFKNK